MGVDLNQLQKDLAQHKVYDAWTYVESLQETLVYMEASYQLIHQVHSNRVSRLNQRESEVLSTFAKEGKASVTLNDLKCTDLSIAGLKISDDLFLRKTTIEFFHYARINFDIVFQIINAALFGDKAQPKDARNLISAVNKMLERNPKFTTMKQILDNNKDSKEFEYIQDFDNYCKHNKTVKMSIKNSFIIGNQNEFNIKAFTFKDFKNKIHNHLEVDALQQIEQAYNHTKTEINKMLVEIQKQIPNCVDNSSRIQQLSYKIQLKKTENSVIPELAVIFIDVNNSLCELPNRIKVYPLLVKPNDEIYSCTLEFDTIFIKKKGKDEDSIVGYAEVVHGQDSNSMYKEYDVHPCDLSKYYQYFMEFKQKYNRIKLNQYAMEGTILIYKE